MHAVCVQIGYGLRKQLLRRAFIKRPADRIDSRLTKFIRRIKALTRRHYIVFIRVYRMKGFFSHKLHQRLIGCVPADDFMRGVEQRLRIFTDRQVHHTFDFGMIAKLRNRNGTAVCRKEIHYFKHAFCNRTRLIAEQNIQRSCGLDTFRFSHKHVMIEHFARILHQHERYHKRKSFRYRADDNNYRQRNCPDHILKNHFDAIAKISRYASGYHDKMYKIQDRNRNRSDVPKGRYLFCQLCQLYLERRIRFVFLHFLCHFTHHRL